MFLPEHIDYTSCFCEENVYKLAERACQSGFGERTFVVFISSVSKCTPIWCQKSSPSANEPVCWDYHVIMLIRESQGEKVSTVYDLDSNLPFPSSFDTYFENSFRPQVNFKPEYMQ